MAFRSNPGHTRWPEAAELFAAIAIKRKLGRRYRASWLNEYGCKSICSGARWRAPGRCPFPGQKDRKSAGNNRTEAMVFPRHELGIDTGIDLEKPIEAARLALDGRVIDFNRLRP